MYQLRFLKALANIPEVSKSLLFERGNSHLLKESLMLMLNAEHFSIFANLISLLTLNGLFTVEIQNIEFSNLQKCHTIINVSYNLKSIIDLLLGLPLLGLQVMAYIRYLRNRAEMSPNN